MPAQFSNGRSLPHCDLRRAEYLGAIPFLVLGHHGALAGRCRSGTRLGMSVCIEVELCDLLSFSAIDVASIRSNR